MSQQNFRNMSGYKLALIYGYTPNLLGLCGPKEKSKRKTISEFLSGKKVSEKKIREIIESFKAACPYYRLIAKSNNKKDFLDERVVRAYWIGNELLPKVKKLSSDFLPHHSFHVLNVGTLSGKLDENLLDCCLIKWGRVRNIKYQKSNIKKLKVLIDNYQPLEKKGKKFALGNPVEKEVVWNKLLAPKLEVGDWVSIHWQNIMEKLSEKDLKNLKKYTKINLEAYF